MKQCIHNWEFRSASNSIKYSGKDCYRCSEVVEVFSKSNGEWFFCHRVWGSDRTKENTTNLGFITKAEAEHYLNLWIAF